MNDRSFKYSGMSVLTALVIAITTYPADVQSTVETRTLDEGENFQLFMQCLFGEDISEEDIADAMDGSDDSTPTEQEIRDCFAPLYNTGTDTDDATDTDADETGGDQVESSAEGSEDEDESDE